MNRYRTPSAQRPALHGKLHKRFSVSLVIFFWYFYWIYFLFSQQIIFNNGKLK